MKETHLRHFCDWVGCSGNPCIELMSIEERENYYKELKVLISKSNKFFIQIVTQKPWGIYKVLAEDAFYKVKQITIDPEQRISLQTHKYRDELWKIISGKFLVEIQDKEWNEPLFYTTGSVFRILRTQKHRITNTSKTEPLVFIEIQTGDSFYEDDVVRYSDDYNRI